jgi:hypothetical protein
VYFGSVFSAADQIAMFAFDSLIFFLDLSL